MRVLFMTLAALALTSCGGGNGRATGVIGTACLEAGRSGASAQLCNCIQSAASQTLSNSDQTRAAEFFADPELAQSTRISDSRSADAFWERYRAFTNRAEQDCRA